jgi:hypothetical protein
LVIFTCQRAPFGAHSSRVSVWVIVWMDRWGCQGRIQRMLNDKMSELPGSAAATIRLPCWSVAVLVLISTAHLSWPIGTVPVLRLRRRLRRSKAGLRASCAASDLSVAAAFLVLLAAATGARVVATDLGRIANWCKCGVGGDCLSGGVADMARSAGGDA